MRHSKREQETRHAQRRDEDSTGAPAVTAAIALLVLRALASGVWVVVHVAQVVRARRRGAAGFAAWVAPASTNWRAGDRAGPAAWAALLAAYVAAAVASAFAR